MYGEKYQYCSLYSTIHTWLQSNPDLLSTHAQSSCINILHYISMNNYGPLQLNQQQKQLNQQKNFLVQFFLLIQLQMNCISKVNQPKVRKFFFLKSLIFLFTFFANSVVDDLALRFLFISFIILISTSIGAYYLG